MPLTSSCSQSSYSQGQKASSKNCLTDLDATSYSAPQYLTVTAKEKNALNSWYFTLTGENTEPENLLTKKFIGKMELKKTVFFCQKYGNYMPQPNTPHSYI